MFSKESKAQFRRRIFHVSNRMHIRHMISSTFELGLTILSKTRTVQVLTQVLPLRNGFFYLKINSTILKHSACANVLNKTSVNTRHTFNLRR